MAIVEFDKKTFVLLKREIDAAVAAVAEKHGIKIASGSGKLGYGAKSLEIKLDLAVIENGKVLSKEAEAFKLYAVLEGLQETDLGRSFTFTSRAGEKTYEITGYSSKAKQYPILAKDASGATYKFRVDQVKAGLI